MCLFEFDQEKHERTVRNEGRLEGRLEGQNEERKAIVERLLNNGLTKQQIVKFTGFSEQEIEQILN